MPHCPHPIAKSIAARIHPAGASPPLLTLSCHQQRTSRSFGGRRSQETPQPCWPTPSRAPLRPSLVFCRAPPVAAARLQWYAAHHPPPSPRALPFSATTSHPPRPPHRQSPFLSNCIMLTRICRQPPASADGSFILARRFCCQPRQSWLYRPRFRLQVQLQACSITPPPLTRVKCQR